MPIIQTVRGAIDPTDFGYALVHEHILCDFIGAAKTGRHRWNPQEVFAAILPKLNAARERDITGFVDCTPGYIGRDPELLRRLSEAADMHILTNTGYYGAADDKFVPAHAFTDTVDELASRWVREWEQGIEDTGIKPGFIKVGVNPVQGQTTDAPNHGLSGMDAKIIRAAARTHKRTQLPIATHTGQGLAHWHRLRSLRRKEWTCPPSSSFTVTPSRIRTTTCKSHRKTPG